MQHLAPDGILAVHISNRFLDLKPVLANIAAAEGLQIRLVSDHPPEPASMSDWVLISRTSEPFSAEALTVAEPLAATPAYSLWTDRFNNLLDVLKTNPLEEIKRLLTG